MSDAELTGRLVKACADPDHRVLEAILTSGVVCLRDTNRTTLCHVAAANRNEKVLALLIGAGADVDVRDARGTTPLLNAALNANEKVAAMLLAAGAHVDSVNDAGETACHRAAGNANEAVLTMLIEAGADCRRATTIGRMTPCPLCSGEPK